MLTTTTRARFDKPASGTLVSKRTCGRVFSKEFSVAPCTACLGGAPAGAV
jgi:hypothetical protein